MADSLQRASASRLPDLHVVILAAGQGTRMRSGLPKVLQPLAGGTLLGHCLDTARELTGGQVTVVVGHGAEQVRQCYASADCGWVEQREQLGTGHAVLQALPLVDPGQQVLILYADVPLLEVSTLRQVLAAAQTGLAVLTAHYGDATGYGRILRDAAGGVTGIVEHKDANDDQRRIDEINTGIMALPGRLLHQWLPRIGNDNAQKEYYLTDLVAMAVADGVPVAGVVCNDAVQTQGVNDKQQLAAAERELQRRQANALMAAGVTLRDPARFDQRGRLTCGRDVEIDCNVVCEGEVTIAEGARVGANCYLKNCRIGADAVIHANSVIEDATVGAGAQVGPFGRLRPGTVLATGARVGNFVEIKNSHIGLQSKVNHLAYVGDSDVGERVNIGAGVITCNYDGANKHRTIIEDDAFIGSDCQLVAPVRVGKGATLGAGTTLAKDAPAGKLTLTRAPQRTSETWRRPVKGVS